MNNEYPIRLYFKVNETKSYWVTEYIDLPGCVGVGNTKEEALEDGEINKENWLDAALEIGKDIPTPSAQYTGEYSGKFNLRLPKYLHRDLTLLSEEQDVSLNTLCISVLSEARHIISKRIKSVSMNQAPTETKCSSDNYTSNGDWNCLTSKASITRISDKAC